MTLSYVPPPPPTFLSCLQSQIDASNTSTHIHKAAEPVWCAASRGGGGGLPGIPSALLNHMGASLPPGTAAYGRIRRAGPLDKEELKGFGHRTKERDVCHPSLHS